MLGAAVRDGAEETKDYATCGGSAGEGAGCMGGFCGVGCAVFEPCVML